MTSSGTYAYSPAYSAVVKSAYGQIGIRGPAITAEHLWDAGEAGNYILAEWSNLQPLLWKSELISQVLTQGTATYALPARVVMILIAYIDTTSGTTTTARVLGPLSTTEYASMPNKAQQGVPTSFWLNRLATPEVTTWPVADDGGPYTMQMRCVSQVQDVSLPSGVTQDLPYRAFAAFLDGLSWRLSILHRPEMEDKRFAAYQRSWNIFSGNDVENTPVYIIPSLNSYYPR